MSAAAYPTWNRQWSQLQYQLLILSHTQSNIDSRMKIAFLRPFLVQHYTVTDIARYRVHSIFLHHIFLTALPATSPLYFSLTSVPFPFRKEFSILPFSSEAGHNIYCQVSHRQIPILNRLQCNFSFSWVLLPPSVLSQ